MHPIYTETTHLDQRCYDHFALTPEILMEHAGAALARFLRKRLTCKTRVLFVCGNGNNGADGMVAARLLQGACEVHLFLPFGLKSPLATRQMERFERCGGEKVEALEWADIIVDCLFGAGLNRPLSEEVSKLIDAINAQNATVIACDIPSGLRYPFEKGAIIKAEHTLTMGGLKHALFSDAAKAYVGKITVADLGLPRHCYETLSPMHLLQKKDLKLPIRHHPDTHKGDYGHVAIILGNKEGAARIAGMGAFYFGAGLVTLVGPKPTQLPAYLMHTPTLPTSASVVVAGMGLEPPYESGGLEAALLGHTLPLVIDASLCDTPWLERLLHTKRTMVLTPHPKEFCAIYHRLFGEALNIQTLQNDRFGYAQAFATRFPHCVLLLKGANTLIARDDQLFVNPLGTPALAKGGSGDLLAGMIGALIAQGYTPIDAAIHASLAHALGAKRLKMNNYALTPKALCKGVACLSKK